MVLVLNPPQPKKSFSEELGSGIGRGLERGVERGLDFANQMSSLKYQGKDKQKIKEALMGHGVSEQEADLYTTLTTGGQTAFVKDLLEEKKRSSKAENQFKGYSDADEDREIKNILKSQDEGLTPAEKVARSKERFASGEKVRSEAQSKLRALTGDKRNLEVLDSLNKTSKLPEDFGRLNVDSDGNLRFPFAASPESQRFIKTLNEFSSNAKDTFGSRVTNFDLSQYMKRYPTLLNSKEGRRQLLDQMKIVNDLNAVYYKNLDEVYRKAGGARSIDSDVAEDLAMRKSEPKVTELSKKLSQIGQFESLPSAAEFPGKKIRNRETGEIMISDGVEWRPAE